MIIQTLIALMGPHARPLLAGRAHMKGVQQELLLLLAHGFPQPARHFCYRDMAAKVPSFMA